jgi:CHAT domain-containing protein
VNCAELADRLMEAGDAESEALLRQHSPLANLTLAYALKDICYDAWQTTPKRSIRAANAVKILSKQNSDPEIAAVAEWVAGIGALVEGYMDHAIRCLDTAEARFQSLGKNLSAASTQVSKLIALATLGRYDEAISCGLKAREIFLAHRDLLAAGKIEHNIGNIYFRRDQYRKAEEFQNSARTRFLDANDQIQLTKIENSLALTLSQQHKIRPAEDLYHQALHRAEQSGQIAIQAAIESSIGILSLFEGRYDRALDYLERSRRKYATLDLPTLLATTEQEIADAYLELNLAPEAAEIYERVAPRFEALGMRAEQAHALANSGKAASLLGQNKRAGELFELALDLYQQEHNEVGVALVSLSRAQLFYAMEDFSSASFSAWQAESRLRNAQMPRPLLFTHWLQGEIARAEGKEHHAQEILDHALRDAEKQEQPELVARCHTSLGMLATSRKDSRQAEEHFKAAVAIIEDLRAPLPAEEFRRAFFANKLIPYTELTRLYLGEVQPRLAEAFMYVERAKARALAEAMVGTMPAWTKTRDGFEDKILKRLEELREELNYFYNQLNRGMKGSGANQDQLSNFQQIITDREKQILELTRQLQHRSDAPIGISDELDLKALQLELGDETAVVEYFSNAGNLEAFILTNEGIEIERGLGTESQVFKQLEQFRFQIDTLRHGSGAIRKHLQPLEERARHHLQQLYDLLMGRWETRLGVKRVVVVPHRVLHYVPFHALNDGDSYLIQRREVSYAPSSSILQQCLRRKNRSLEKGLLAGVADEQTPRVDDELKALESVFSEVNVLMGSEATIGNLKQRAELADVVHLACHGQFRPDNPTFSSLRLADGWLTVRDANQLNLNCTLVTLSACETGVNTVAPGEEIIGLTRGFLTAGARSLLISLWTVDDDATAEFMADFYKCAQTSKSLSAAVRRAQMKMLERYPHPFFWSPFSLVGGW